MASPVTDCPKPFAHASALSIGGRIVADPEDVCVARIDAGLCAVGTPCPEAPLYVLRRGQSEITVGVQSGTIETRHIAPGDASAFSFLAE